MKQGKAVQLLALLLLVSLVLWGITALLMKVRPDLYLQANRQSPEAMAAARYALLDELPIEKSPLESAQINQFGVLAWPQVSLISSFHKVDLALFKGQSKGSKSLQGITVFLDIGAAADLQRPQPGGSAETTQSSKRIAQTDPYTGLPINPNRVSKEPENQVTAVSEAPRLAESAILPTLASRLREKLEGMGARVLFTRDLSESDTELSQAAAIGSELLDSFLRDLSANSFKAPSLEALRSDLQQATHDPLAAGVQSLFREVGVSPELRLLLDMERQYQDSLCIAIRLGDARQPRTSETKDGDAAAPPQETAAEGESETTDPAMDSVGALRSQARRDAQSAPGGENGLRVFYLGSLAGSLGATRLEENSLAQPAYAAYGSSDRRRLAEGVEGLVRENVSELAYQGSKTAVTEEASDLARFTNISTITVKIGERRSESDMASLRNGDRLNALADAIATACYNYYCE